MGALFGKTLTEEICQLNQPKTWIDVNYGFYGENCHLIELDQASEEYDVVKTRFINKMGAFHEILKIDRVQHPFAFASSKLNCSHKNGNFTMTEYKASSEDTGKFLELNCDPRAKEGTAPGIFIQVEAIPPHLRNSSGAHWYPSYVIRTSEAKEFAERDRNNVGTFLADLLGKLLFE